MRLRVPLGHVAVIALLFAPLSTVLAFGGFTGTGLEGVRGVLPDGSVVPASEMSSPASVSRSGADGLPPGVVVAGSGDSGGSAGGVDEADGGPDGTAADLGIPGPALAAYQRAATVINAADPDCKLAWELLAAIGRVESDHGRFGESTIDADGTVTPPIIGIQLDGERGTQVPDSDDGRIDGDSEWDRAVGPMQFIPATWAAVGVDGDDDGLRDPQDLDDAALAAAVYLCAGSHDLSTTTGQREAVFRYNRSTAYVSLVLKIMADYQNSTGETVAALPAPNRPNAPAATPPGPPGAAPGRPGGRPGKPRPPKSGSGDPNRPSLPEVSAPPRGTRLSPAEAAAQCAREGKVNNPLRSDDPFDRCVAGYTR
ncbi:MAG: lytic murein transglycosylase [Nocardioides sp.]